MESPVRNMTKEEVVQGLKQSLKARSKNDLVRIAIQLIFDNENLKASLPKESNDEASKE